MKKIKGFTLIELLVVVVIIGILAAIALPQYQQIIEKTRASEALMNVRSLKAAVDRYYLINGSYNENSLSIDDLDIDIKTNNNFFYVINAAGIQVSRLPAAQQYRISYVLPTWASEGYYFRNKFLCDEYVNNKYKNICTSLGAKYAPLQDAGTVKRYVFD